MDFERIKPGKMCKYFKNGSKSKTGKYKIKYEIFDEERVKKEKTMAMFDGSYGEVFDLVPGTYTVLHDGISTIMSDTPMECRTNDEIISKAHGDILIGGLGLGVILLELQKNLKVKNITIIEIDKELIDFILPKIPIDYNKVTIICDDIFKWNPPKGKRYDTIYFDIWNDICADNYKDMKLLHAIYRKFRRMRKENPDSITLSWRKEDVKRLSKESLYW